MAKICNGFMLCHRSERFAGEQAELHQKLAVLQKELTVFKQQYESLLEQVGQQHSLIQQLSASQTPGDRSIHMQEEETDGESKVLFFFIKHIISLEYVYLNVFVWFTQLKQPGRLRSNQHLIRASAPVLTPLQ